jgi:hypothetical protein
MPWNFTKSLKKSLEKTSEGYRTEASLLRAIRGKELTFYSFFSEKPVRTNFGKYEPMYKRRFFKSPCF